jgi:hypothetical protein
MMATKVTAADVKDITGVDVDDSTIDLALSIIEVHTSVDCSDLDVFHAKDRTWIKKAICYESAWIPDQPDLFSRMGVTNLSQDGMSFQPAGQDAFTLAPLARKSLGRVSWRRTRTALVARGRAVRLADRMAGGDPVYDLGDDIDPQTGEPWIPMSPEGYAKSRIVD